MDNHNDWFLSLKLEVLSLVSLLQMLKEDMIIMLTMSEWVIEDVSVGESFKKLQQILTKSHQDLEYFVREIKRIEQGSFFSVVDLKDEFDYIHDSIYLELDYMNHIADYLLQSNQIGISKRHTKVKYLNEEERYLEQIESNQQQLKHLRKERRENYFE